MKKLSELIMFTLFFSTLSGIGLTAGFTCFIGVSKLLLKVIG